MGQNLGPQIVTPALTFKEITDQYVRKNFQNLVNYFTTQNQLLNFQFFEQVFTEATTSFNLSHNLGFVPQDIVMVNCVGNGSLSVNFGQANSKTINLSVTGPLRARFFLGTYWNAVSKYNFANTDCMIFTCSPNATFATSTSVSSNVTTASTSVNGFTAPYLTTLRVTAQTTSISGSIKIPSGLLYLDVEMVGGGGGGGGSSSGSAATGGAGVATTFSTLTANGGGGGTGATVSLNGTGGSGGTAITVANFPVGWIGYEVAGANGGYGNALSTTFALGGEGGSSRFGGSAPGATGGSNGPAAQSNSGSGGGGAGSIASTNLSSGGGGSGAYIFARLLNPASFNPSLTFSYTIGRGGAGAGTSVGGGNGGAGQIILRGYYQ